MRWWCWSWCLLGVDWLPIDVQRRPAEHRGNPSNRLGRCRGRSCTDAMRSSRRSPARSMPRARRAAACCCVRGEAGIGKTRLLAELRERAAAQRFVVLEGRATRAGERVPLVPILDALEPRLPDAGVLATLGPSASGCSPRCSRGCRRRGAPLGDRALAPSSRARRAARAVAAGRPLLLVVDDVHWADPATLRAARAPGAPPARRVAAARASAPRPGAGGRAPARGAARRAARSASSALDLAAAGPGGRGAAAGGRPRGRRARTALRAVRRQPAAAAASSRATARPTPSRAASSPRCAPRSTRCPETPGRCCRARRSPAIRSTSTSRRASPALDDARGARRARCDRGAASGPRRGAARAPLPPSRRAHAPSTRGSARASGSRGTPRPRASWRARVRRADPRAPHLALRGAARRRRGRGGAARGRARCPPAGAGGRRRLAARRRPRRSGRRRPAALPRRWSRPAGSSAALDVIDAARRRCDVRLGRGRRRASSGCWGATTPPAVGCPRALRAELRARRTRRACCADLAVGAYQRGDYAEMRGWAERARTRRRVRSVAPAAAAHAARRRRRLRGRRAAASRRRAAARRTGGSRRRRARRCRRARDGDLLGLARARPAARRAAPRRADRAAPRARRRQRRSRRSRTTSRRCSRSGCSGGWPRPSRPPTRPSRRRA